MEGFAEADTASKHEHEAATDDQKVVWRNPQHVLQVEAVQLHQEELYSERLIIIIIIKL